MRNAGMRQIVTKNDLLVSVKKRGNKPLVIVLLSRFFRLFFLLNRLLRNRLRLRHGLAVLNNGRLNRLLNFAGAGRNGTGGIKALCSLNLKAVLLGSGNEIIKTQVFSYEGNLNIRLCHIQFCYQEGHAEEKLGF